MAFNFHDAIRSDSRVQDKLKVFQPRKEPPRVLFQNPAPGAPLLKGMVVEVKLVSASDVAVGDLLEDVPLALKDFAVPEVTKFIDTHPEAAAILHNDALPADKRVEFLNAVNQGFRSNVSDADAGKAFNAIKFFAR